MTELSAAEHGLPGARLRRVVSRAAGGARCRARAARASRFASASTRARVGGTPAYASISLASGATRSLTARLAAIADGAARRSPASSASVATTAQVALIAKVVARSPASTASRSSDSRPTGPMALLPERDHYGLVWTMTPRARSATLALSDDAFLAALAASFGPRVERIRARGGPRASFPLALEFARPTVAARVVAHRQRRAGACIRWRARASISGLRDAFELARSDSRRAARRARQPRMLDRYARGRATRSRRGHRVHARPAARCSAPAPRGCAGRAGWRSRCSMRCRPAKRAFTRAMLFGLR